MRLSGPHSYLFKLNFHYKWIKTLRVIIKITGEHQQCVNLSQTQFFNRFYHIDQIFKSFLFPIGRGPIHIEQQWICQIQDSMLHNYIECSAVTMLTMYCLISFGRFFTSVSVSALIFLLSLLKPKRIINARSAGSNKLYCIRKRQMTTFWRLRNLKHKKDQICIKTACWKYLKIHIIHRNC